jgi:hypothetical protein
MMNSTTVLIEDDKLDETLRLFTERGIQYGDVTQVLDPHKSYMRVTSIDVLLKEKLGDIKEQIEEFARLVEDVYGAPEDEENTA